MNKLLVAVVLPTLMLGTQAAMAAYGRALELYRELVDRRDYAVAEASNQGKPPHDK